MPLALALAIHDANSITKGTTVYNSLRQLKQSTIWLFCHVLPLALVLVSCNTTALLSVYVMWTASLMAPLHFLGQEYQNKVQHDFFFMCHHSYWNHVMPMPMSQLKLCVPWLFHHLMPLVLASHVTWCLQHHPWHQCFPWVKTTKMSCNKTFLVMQWCWHMMPMILWGRQYH